MSYCIITCYIAIFYILHVIRYLHTVIIWVGLYKNKMYIFTELYIKNENTMFFIYVIYICYTSEEKLKI